MRFSGHPRIFGEIRLVRMIEATTILTSPSSYIYLANAVFNPAYTLMPSLFCYLNQHFGRPTSYFAGDIGAFVPVSTRVLKGI